MMLKRYRRISLIIMLFTILLSIIHLPGATVVTSAAGVNLVTDPGFEEIPSEWSLHQSPVISSEAARNGDLGLKLPAAIESWASIGIEGWEEGKTYRLISHSKYSNINATTKAETSISVYSSAGKSDLFNDHADITTDWKESVNTFTIPAGTTAVVLSTYRDAGGVGDYYCDDFVLEEVPSSNLVSDPGFEKIPTEWSLHQSPEISSEAARNGDLGLKLPAAIESWASIGIEGWEEGKTYRLISHSKYSNINATTKAETSISVYSSAGKSDLFNDHADITTDWKESVNTFTIPAGTTAVVLSAYRDAGGVGDYYCDDFVLEEVPSSNLVSDPGFEKIPSEWSLHQSPVISSEAARNGDLGLKLPAAIESWATITIVGWEEGKTYKLTSHSKYSNINATTKAETSISVYSSAGKIDLFNDHADITTDWQESVNTFTIPVGTTAVVLSTYRDAGGVGDYYCDDFSIEEFHIAGPIVPDPGFENNLWALYGDAIVSAAAKRDGDKGLNLPASSNESYATIELQGWEVGKTYDLTYYSQYSTGSATKKAEVAITLYDANGKVTPDLVKHFPAVTIDWLKSTNRFTIPEGTTRVILSTYRDSGGIGDYYSDDFKIVESNLITNGNFEDGRSNWDLRGTYNVGSAYKYSGINGVMIGINSMGVVKQFFDVGQDKEIKPGDNLKFSAMAKVLGPRKPFTLMIVTYDVYGYKTVGTRTFNNTEWASCELFVTVPSNAVEMEAILYVEQASDGAYVDDVQLVVTDEEEVEEVEDPNWGTDVWAEDQINGRGGTINSSASHSNGTFTVTNTTYDSIWAGTDKMTYLSKQERGNFSITAKLVSMGTDGDWNKAGLMIRDTLQPDSKNFFAGAMTWENQTISPYLSVRKDNNGSTSPDSKVMMETQSSGYVMYIRIDKYDNYYTAYYSNDGVSWLQWRDTQEVKMGQNVYIGFTGTNDDSPGNLPIVFSDFTLSTNVTAPANENLNYEKLNKPVWDVDIADIPAFSGAQGGGAGAFGGRGGEVYYVTNLNDSGDGSLRKALTGDTPRIVLFKVGGVIKLNSPINSGSYKTVAGHTAPGGGITLTAEGFTETGALIKVAEKHDIVIRYLTFRHGVTAYTPPGLQGIPNGDNDISIEQSYNVIIDHCSLSWGNQNNAGVWSNGTFPTKNITFSYNIIAEAPLVNQSTGINLGSDDRMVDVDVHHNLFTANGHRNPEVKTKSTRVVNNIIANWENYGSGFVAGVHLDIVGNLYKPSSGSNLDRIVIYDGFEADNTELTGYPSVYITDNKVAGHSEFDSNNWDMIRTPARYTGTLGAMDSKFQRGTALPDSAFPIVVEAVSGLENSLLPVVGNSQMLNADGTFSTRRDGNDLRIIANTTNNVSWQITNQSEVGGYPTIASGTAYVDSDGDGLPDVWELAYGYDPDDSSDGKSEYNQTGYSVLEHFLNGN